MKRYFPSRKSLILGLFIWGIFLGVMVICAIPLFKTFALYYFLILLLINIVLFIFIGTIWFRTGYLVEKNSLTVKVGPVIFYKVPIEDIWTLKRTWTVLSSPANAL